MAEGQLTAIIFIGTMGIFSWLAFDFGRDYERAKQQQKTKKDPPNV